MARIAMIGATGLIGADLARRLIEEGHELTLVGRRASGIDGATDVVVPVDRWEEALHNGQVDVAISTLGTTRKQAGSTAAFEAVDRHAVAAFARAAKSAGARQWMMVSSVGADPASRNSYLAVKGRAEADVLALGFERVDILQPGLLVGDRQESRPAERFGILISPFINPLLLGALDRYRAIPAGRVAEAMAALAGQSETGVHIHQNRQIRAISGLG